MESVYNVSDAYRAAVFWSFNDKLEDERLTAQLERLVGAGLTGGFMHSRVGLVTAYLSDDWMQRLAACCEKAREMGTVLWLYDEDRWPSGYGGGQVIREHPECKSKALCLIEDNATEDPRILQVYKTVDYEGKRYRIALCEQKAGNPWYAGGCYVDLLDPAATDAFLQSTHERYRERLGEYFGKEIQGIFSDEFCYSQRAAYPYPNVPFTRGFEERFCRSRGYSLLDVMEKLFFDLPGYQRVRFDFYDELTSCFIEAFTARYRGWCQKNGLQLTGHLMNEDTLTGQTEWIGAAMPHYAEMDMPGIDMLGSAASQPATVLQLTSVAEQLGKRALCEALGCIGHQSGPAEMKRLTDYLAALGISFINPHLTLYSMRGERKRDYPPNISWMQPWFDAARGYFDHIARVCELMSEGECETDLLLLHPIGSVWSEMSPLHKMNPTYSIWSQAGTYARQNYLTETETVEKPFFELTEVLLHKSIPFHYGDERLMEAYGTDEDGYLCIGRCRYRRVIVPPMTTIRRATLLRLERLAAQNGPQAVVFAGRYPVLIDGEAADYDFAARFTLLPDAAKTVQAMSAAPLRIKALDVYTGAPAPDVLIRQRLRGDGGHVYFLANTAQGRARRLAITVDAVAEPVALDTITGRYVRVPFIQTAEGFRCRVCLKPGGSLLLADGDAAALPETDLLHSGADFAEDLRLLRQAPVTQRTMGVNILPLDRADFTDTAGTAADAPVESLWARFNRLPEGTPFEAVYRFWVTEMPAGGMWAMIEQARHLDGVFINDQPADKIIPVEDADGCFDFSFDRVLLNGLHVGENTICLRGRKCNNIIGVGNHRAVPEGTDHRPTELETVFVCGDFRLASDGRGYAIAGNGAPVSGDITAQGYPFYGGALRITAEFGRVPEADRLLINGAAAAASLTINGKPVGEALLPPLSFPVQGLLEQDTNRVEITLYGTLANTFGPIHLHNRSRLPMIGPMLIADMTRYNEAPELFAFGAASLSLLGGGKNDA